MLALLPVAGCTSEAEQTTTEKREMVPRKVGTFMVKGHQAFERGAYNVVLAMADSAKKYAPALADVYFLRALALSELKRFDEANAAYKEVLALDPNYQGTRLNLGRNAFHQGQYRKALKWYKEEQAIYPELGNLVRMGHAYFNLGRVDSARQAYQQALAQESGQVTEQSTWAHVGLSQLYEKRGAFEKALEHSRQVLKTEPENQEYRYLVGSQLYQAGHLEEAVEKLDAVVKQRPQHFKAHHALGQALISLGRQEEGERHIYRADSLRNAQANIHPMAVEAEKNPDEPMRWVKLGDAQRNAGRLEEAIASYKIALSLLPGNIPLQTNVATLLLKQGRTQEAVQRYQAVLGQDSTVAEAWLNLGVAYAEGGDTAAARRAWKKTLTYRPGDERAKANLARLPK